MPDHTAWIHPPAGPMLTFAIGYHWIDPMKIEFKACAHHLMLGSAADLWVPQSVLSRVNCRLPV